MRLWLIPLVPPDTVVVVLLLSPRLCVCHGWAWVGGGLGVGGWWVVGGCVLAWVWLRAPVVAGGWLGRWILQAASLFNKTYKAIVGQTGVEPTIINTAQSAEILGIKCVCRT